MKKSFGSTFVLIMVLFVLAGCLSPGNGQGKVLAEFTGEVSIEDMQSVSVGDDGKLYILQFTDTQSSSTAAHAKVEKVMAAAYAKAKDRVTILSGGKSEIGLIALTGDNYGGPLGSLVQKDLISFLDSFGVPYAAVYGNHDKEAGNLSAMGEIWENGKNSMFKMGPQEIYGVGNYVVNVKNLDDEIAASLLFIDSNSGKLAKFETFGVFEHEFGGLAYDFIHLNQIQWAAQSADVVNEVAGRTADNMLPLIAFFHIPIPEYRAIDRYSKEFSPEVYADNVNAWLPQIAKDNKEFVDEADVDKAVAAAGLPAGDYEVYDGYILIDQGKEGSKGPDYPYTKEKMATRKGETVCNSAEDAGFFDTMKAKGLKGVFVGHDHVNNFAFDYKDVTLTYGLKTGESSYHDDDMNGGTLIIVDGETGEFEIEHIFVDLEEARELKKEQMEMHIHGHSHGDHSHTH